MLPCVEHWTTSREEFLKYSLVEMNDQVFESNGSGFWSLHCDTVSLLRQETIICLQRALSVSTETCFEELARGALATATSLCLRICKGLLLPPGRTCLNFYWPEWMTDISAIDPKVWSSHCDTWFSAVENDLPSGVAILFSIDLQRETYKKIVSRSEIIGTSLKKENFK